MCLHFRACPVVHACMFHILQTIVATQPDVVMVELCNSRMNILQYDEESLLKEAKEIDIRKIKSLVMQVGPTVNLTFDLLFFKGISVFPLSVQDRLELNLTLSCWFLH